MIPMRIRNRYENDECCSRRETYGQIKNESNEKAIIYIFFFSRKTSKFQLINFFSIFLHRTIYSLIAIS